MLSIHDDLEVFCTVAQSGSFQQAGKLLKMPHSTVSRRVAALEDKLETQLIVRTTRQLRLTAIGQTLFDSCGPLLKLVRNVVDDNLDEKDELVGEMKVSLPVRAALDFFGPILIEFAATHPKLQLDIELDNAQVDLVSSGVDMAFRVGPLADSSAIAVKLWDIPMSIVAHPRLLEAHGVDAQHVSVKQLTELPAVVAPPQRTWALIHKSEGEISINPKVALRVNDLHLATHGAIQGLGLVYAPQEMLCDVPGNEGLVALQGEDWQTLTRTMYASYTGNRHSSKRLRSLIDFVREKYQMREESRGKAPV